MVVRRGRGRRRSAEETRQIMVQAGVDQLRNQGLNLGVDLVTLDAACMATGVPRSSSHAAWAGDDEDFSPQTRFQRAVVKRWLDECDHSVLPSGVVQRFIAARNDEQELSVGELVRTAIAVDSDADLESCAGGVDAALRHAMVSQPIEDRDPTMLDWLRSAEWESTDQMVSRVYRPLANALGLEPRGQFGDRAFELLAVAVASLTEGLTARHEISPTRGYMESPTYIDARPGDVPSTLLGVTVEALIHAFFEPASVVHQSTHSGASSV